VEPRKDTYLPFLKPLLDAPGSRYHLRDWDGRTPWQAQKYITEGLLPNLQLSENSSRDPAAPNDSLLIVVNASSRSDRQKPQTGLGHESHQAIISFTNDIRTGSGFHAHGPVRMLLWVPEVEKQALLPRTVCHRRKIALALEMTCQVEEIVGGASASVRELKQHREDFLNIESGKQVAERMRRKNIQIPVERQDGMQRKVQDILQGSTSGDAVALRESDGTLPDSSRKWHKELRQLKADFESGKLSQFIGGPPGVRTNKRRNDPRTHSPEWVRLMEMERNLKSQQREKIDVLHLIVEQEKLDSLELDAYQDCLSEAERREKLEEVDRRTRELKTRLDNVTNRRSMAFKFIVDDRKAFVQNPPLLMWDQRTAEPLIAQDYNFYKPKDIALLDIQPKFPNPYPLTTAQAIYLDMIVARVFTHGNQTPTVGLKQLAPGAFEALVPRVPALQDLRKGGCRNIEDLRCRVMTPEMFYDLALAWEKWPFKPPVPDLMYMNSD
jgi:transcription factor 1